MSEASAVKAQKQSVKYKVLYKLFNFVARQLHQINMVQEFNHIKALSIGGVFIQSACIKSRTLIVHFRPSSETKPVIELKMTFPSVYPAAAPSFTIVFNTTGIPDDIIKQGILFDSLDLLVAYCL